MITWLAHATAREATVFRIGRDGNRLVAEWVGLARLAVDRDGTHEIFTSVPGADASLLQKLEIGTKRALLRHLRGELTLHAAAVVIRGSAIAFVGDSGAGKSTLAFALANAHETNAGLISDDCLCVDGALALPSETAGWIERAGHGVKSPLTPARLATEAAALRAIVTLAYGEGLAVRRLHGTAAAKVLASAMIRFVLDEPEVHRADMNRAADLAERVPIFELRRPRGLEHIAATSRKVDELSAALR